MHSVMQTLLGWLNNLPSRSPGLKLAADTRLIEQGLLDSIGILDLVSFIEEEFGITLPLDEFVPENFCTPAAIAALVTRLGASACNGESRDVSAG